MTGVYVLAYILIGLALAVSVLVDDSKITEPGSEKLRATVIVVCGIAWPIILVLVFVSLLAKEIAGVKS